ncbi:hypothetical protein AYI69_g4842 [Smittium culicis]|uniref:Uncharacterized protein n=1 Tax=Smittium culicis TaxID=133412 RepID=A0A1R1YAH1_9FUNG|nr:hypothetical protein AYI69_g4842 [Smittium culicis]
MNLLESKLKRSTQRLKTFMESATPAYRLRPLHLKEPIAQMMSPTSTALAISVPRNKRGLATITLRTQRAKDDKLFSEDEQRILDLTDSELKLIVEEISNCSQDLVRLAIHYEKKRKTSRRVFVCQSSGYEKYIATADPGSDISENQYLLHLNKHSPASLVTTIRVKSTASISIYEEAQTTVGTGKPDGEVAQN